MHCERERTRCVRSDTFSNNGCSVSCSLPQTHDCSWSPRSPTGSYYSHTCDQPPSDRLRYTQRTNTQRKHAMGLILKAAQ